MQSVVRAILTTMIIGIVALSAGTRAAIGNDSAERSREHPSPSHRLIVQLDTPPLAEVYQGQPRAAGVTARLDIQSPDSQRHIERLQAEQAVFIAQMRSVLHDASVATFINEFGSTEEAAYQIVFNGVSIDPGRTDRNVARTALAALPGVKNVYDDYPYTTQLYTSTAFIGAPTVWESPGINGVENAGAGIKFASMDGGLHKDAPMFNGTGWDYPPGFPPGGLGLTANNNGKIIASRAYFRTWDPPLPGNDTPWPGPDGNPHGVHTGSIAAGNCVEPVRYLGYDVGTLCGVAPAAWAMSYLVFYASENVPEGRWFYPTEGIAALEDVVADGADVLNNSWTINPPFSGGPYDPMGEALVNAARAGVFAAASATNLGPWPSTTDHPSDEIITVAASTSPGNIAQTGSMSIGDPDAVDPELKGILFGKADFGPSLPLGSTSYTYRPASAVDATNATGCAPFPPSAFSGKAAILERGGDCFFTDKVYHAQQAGAAFAVVYNVIDDSLLNMGCGGEHCDEVSIASIFVGQTDGAKLLNWYADHGEAATLTVAQEVAQVGNSPDIVADFSSRGPSHDATLKPDITAPGVNILAQGYTPNTAGTDRYFGFGQVSGTSMAGPVVAGAGALLRQLYPEWSNEDIKSALMSTAKYLGIYTESGAPAQPLDMGAGRIDVAAAMDPGILLDPPSLSFGIVPTGTQKAITLTVTSVAESQESYGVSTLYTGRGFTATTSLAGVSVNTSTLTLNPGDQAVLSVTFDASQGAGPGDNQGFVLLSGDNGHNAHLPLWARVTRSTKSADVLLIDADSSYDGRHPDFAWYYRQTLEQLGYTYDVFDTVMGRQLGENVPAVTTLTTYSAVVLFTGQSRAPDLVLDGTDISNLREYLIAGGSLIVMGQNFASLIGADTPNTPSTRFMFMNLYMGTRFVQESVSNDGQPNRLITAASSAPTAMRHMTLDTTSNRAFVMEEALSGAAVVPPAETDAHGRFRALYDSEQNRVTYSIVVTPPATLPMTITSVNIQLGSVGSAGPVLLTLDPSPYTYGQPITAPIAFSGWIDSLTADGVNAMLGGNLYLNVQTTANPDGELRAQILPEPYALQRSVDELDHLFRDGSQDPNPDGYTHFANLNNRVLFRYDGDAIMFDGTVALMSREIPSLERPGVAYNGRSTYFAFGLEDIEESPGNTTRADLLGTALDLSWAAPRPITVRRVASSDEGAVTLTATMDASINTAGKREAAEAVRYRWDFGDGTAYVTTQANTAEHVYDCATPGIYTARAEITDALGMVSLGEVQISAVDICGHSAETVYLPWVER